MAIITGTSGNDTISLGTNSSGFQNGVPSNSGTDNYFGSLGSDTIDLAGGINVFDYSGVAGWTYFNGSFDYNVAEILKSGPQSIYPRDVVNWGGLYIFNDDYTDIRLAGTNTYDITFKMGGGNNFVSNHIAGRLVTFSYEDGLTSINVNLSSGQSNNYGTVSNGFGGRDSFAIRDNPLNFRLSGFSDTYLGANGGDGAEGGSGNDTLDGAGGNDTLGGEDGNDVVHGGDGSDSLLGGNGSDYLTGASGNDVLLGDAGDDVLDGGAGSDNMDGGSGDDQYVVDGAGDFVSEVVDAGTDTVWVRLAGGFELGQNVEIGRLLGAGNQVSTSYSNSVQLVANASLASILSGGTADDVLWGGSNNTSMSGNGGNDTLRDQGSITSMAGGTGDDQYVVNNVASTITEAQGAGTDTAWIAINGFTVSDHVEIVRLGGTANVIVGPTTSAQLVANPLHGSQINARGGDDVLWGSSYTDVFYGSGGDDIIRGQGGADIMHGGIGNDQFVILDAAVQLIEYETEGYDTAWIGLAASTPYTLGANIERANLSGQANTVIGNAADNVLVGDAIASNLHGMAGNDSIYGSTFGDTLTGGAGNDTIYASGGADRIVYAGEGYGTDLINGFSIAAGAKLDFRGSGITFANLNLNLANGNTQVGFFGNPNDIILVFSATLTQDDFLFG